MSAERAKLVVQLTGRIEAVQVAIKHVRKADEAHRREAFLESKRPQAGLWEFVDQITKHQPPTKPEI